MANWARETLDALQIVRGKDLSEWIELLTILTDGRTPEQVACVQAEFMADLRTALIEQRKARDGNGG